MTFSDLTEEEIITLQSQSLETLKRWLSNAHITSDGMLVIDDETTNL